MRRHEHRFGASGPRWPSLVPFVLALGALPACTVAAPATSDAAGVSDAASPPNDGDAHDGGRDAPLADGPTPDGTCATITFAAERTIPSVVVVIDQSGSMALPFGTGGGSRWTTLEDALVGPSGLVTTLEHFVRFGAVMYTDDPEVLGCPDVSTQPASLDGRGNVAALYAFAFPSGNTPTGDTLGLALAQREELFAESTRTGPAVIVLATDGEPGTCADGTDIVGGRQLSVDAAAAAFDAGIETYVLSVGPEIAAQHLQDVANAGVGHRAGDPDAPYWVASDPAGLRAALASIASGALPCTLTLDGRIDPARACRGTVTLGTRELACGTEWTALDESHLALSDAACTLLRSSTDDVQGHFPCDVVVF